MSSKKGLESLLKKAGYPDKAIDFYLRKVNVGEIKGAEAAESHLGFCGDSMKIYLKVQEGLIYDATFQAIGCAGAFASGSALTEMVKGKTLNQAKLITEKDVSDDLGGLPGAKIHCAGLAVDALRKTIESFEKK
jgi:NifU-like protein involved in Fe-S cluster formation